VFSGFACISVASFNLPFGFIFADALRRVPWPLSSYVIRSFPNAPLFSSKARHRRFRFFFQGQLRPFAWLSALPLFFKLFFFWTFFFFFFSLLCVIGLVTARFFSTLGLFLPTPPFWLVGALFLSLVNPHVPLLVRDQICCVLQ